MFDDIKEILRKVYSLARDRRVKYESTYKPSCDICNDAEERLQRYEDRKSGKYEDELEAYLHTLDFETIKVVQTIMYLGRDKDYKEITNGEERYKKERESLNKNKGWKTIDIEIDQIAEKMPLDKYLKEGFEIIGI